jgi:chlorite dismutase
MKFEGTRQESVFFWESLDYISVYPIEYKVDDKNWYLDAKVFCFD